MKHTESGTMATEMNNRPTLDFSENGTVATETSGATATETILFYWHYITEMTGTV